jgi:hypothetical protein
MGPVMTYYGFKHPMGDGLKDQALREMLKENPPDDPEWMENYTG